MTRLSVNLNKVALVRNSRQGVSPDIGEFAIAAIRAGAHGLTVHPRADGRHVRLDDVIALAALPDVATAAIEFNVESDIRPSTIRLAQHLRPTQFTVVPVEPGELTSERGWRAYDDQAALVETVRDLACVGTRVAVFCDATVSSCELAISAGAHAVELYTGHYARAYAAGSPQAEIERLKSSAKLVKAAGLQLNGGHDLSLANLPMLLDAIPFDEVSIGHELTVEALRSGWDRAVGRYVAACAAGSGRRDDRGHFQGV